MKSAATFPTHDRAKQAMNALNLRRVYSCISGCKSRGYDVLVNEQQLGTANEVLTALRLSPEVEQG
jgi:hypothetical protein